MFETVVIATDGSESAGRAVAVALDLAERFGAAVHALYVLDTGEVRATPEEVRADLEAALRDAGDEAVDAIAEQAGAEVTTAVREGPPAAEIVGYAREVEADLVATGTRGRHGEHAFLLGSVAEAMIRRSPIPVLTVRQLAEDEATV